MFNFPISNIFVVSYLISSYQIIFDLVQVICTSIFLIFQIVKETLSVGW